MVAKGGKVVITYKEAQRFSYKLYNQYSPPKELNVSSLPFTQNTPNYLRILFSFQFALNVHFNLVVIYDY